MKRWIFLFTCIFTQVSLAGNSAPELRQRCQAPLSDLPKLYANDFRWGYELSELIQRFTEIYKSPKRLPRRAYWDASANTLKLPYDQDRGGDVAISEGFVQAIVGHVEKAFELKYVDAVFFPDMGHSHLLIPEQVMNEKYHKYPVQDMAAMYRDMFRDPRIQVLYHTAEQLTMLDGQGKVLPDPRIQWRHRTRNIVGTLDGQRDLQVLQNPASSVNTVSHVPGYFWWGAGFNISANANGCFEYQQGGRQFYFDLSLYDLEMDPDQGAVFD